MPRYSLRISIIIPLLVVLLTISLIAVRGGHVIRKSELHKDVERLAAGAEGLWQELVDQDAETLHGLLQFLAQDPELVRAWQVQDRQRLQELSLPLYESLNQKYGITHFYFHQTDRLNFLRVHKPEKHGDRIDRFTLQQAMKNGRPFHGVELGVLGTLTLRVVHPWLFEGEVIGYLELGVEVEHLSHTMGRILGAELLLTVNKEFLGQGAWQEGLEMLGAAGDWNQLPDRVLICSTFGEEVPPPLMVFLRHIGGPMSGLHMVEVGQQVFSGRCLGLTDISGRVVGKITVLLDLTDEIRQLQSHLVRLAVTATLLSLGLILFFFIYLGRIEKKLRENLAEINRTNRQLRSQKEELQEALENVTTLSGLLPICAACKMIRDDKGYWKQLEVYISDHSEMDFSHSICPGCAEKLYPEFDYEEE